MDGNNQPARFVITANLGGERLAVLDLEDFSEEYVPVQGTMEDTLHMLAKIGESSRPQFRIRSLVNIRDKYKDTFCCTSEALFDAVLQYYPKLVRLIRRCVLTGGDNPLFIIKAKNGAIYGVAQKDGNEFKSPVQFAATIPSDGVLSLPTFIKVMALNSASVFTVYKRDYNPIIDVRSGTLVKSPEDLCSVRISADCPANQLTFRSELCQMRSLYDVVSTVSDEFERRHEKVGSGDFTIVMDLVFPRRSSIDMSRAFARRKSLTQVHFTDRANINAYACSATFYGCSSLRAVTIDEVHTIGCRRFENMFNGCSSLVDLVLFRFNFSEAEFLYSMFQGCTNLRHIRFNVFCSDGRDYCDYDNMFLGCDNLRPENVEGIGSSERVSSSVMHELCETQRQREGY